MRRPPPDPLSLITAPPAAPGTRAAPDRPSGSARHGPATSTPAIPGSRGADAGRWTEPPGPVRRPAWPLAVPTRPGSARSATASSRVRTGSRHAAASALGTQTPVARPPETTPPAGARPAGRSCRDPRASGCQRRRHDRAGHPRGGQLAHRLRRVRNGPPLVHRLSAAVRNDHRSARFRRIPPHKPRATVPGPAPFACVSASAPPRWASPTSRERWTGFTHHHSQDPADKKLRGSDLSKVFGAHTHTHTRRRGNSVSRRIRQSCGVSRSGAAFQAWDHLQ